jgi:hypothetical protein
VVFIDIGTDIRGNFHFSHLQFLIRHDAYLLPSN